MFFLFCLIVDNYITVVLIISYVNKQIKIIIIIILILMIVIKIITHICSDKILNTLADYEKINIYNNKNKKNNNISS